MAGSFYKDGEFDPYFQWFLIFCLGLFGKKGRSGRTPLKVIHESDSRKYCGFAFKSAKTDE